MIVTSGSAQFIDSSQKELLEYLSSHQYVLKGGGEDKLWQGI